MAGGRPSQRRRHGARPPEERSPVASDRERALHRIVEATLLADFAMRVLGTRASGHFGGSVANALLAAGHWVMGLVRAVRGRRELGWAPHRPSLLGDIERGSYRDAA